MHKVLKLVGRPSDAQVAHYVQGFVWNLLWSRGGQRLTQIKNLVAGPLWMNVNF